MSLDALRDLLAAPLADSGVDLEDVEIAKAGRRHVVRVIVDTDGGVDLDTVADVSRTVSDLLDTPAAATLVPGPFTLEVTSPGVDRPLTSPRHWRRAKARLVAVTLSDGSTVTGRITGSDDTAATLDVDGAARTVPYADITRAVVQVEFGKLPVVDEAGVEDDDTAGGS